MTILTHLLADHHRLRTLIARLEKASGERRQQVLADLGHELAVHASLEEDLLYPLLERTPLKKKARHAYEEHHLIDVQFDELLVLDSGDPVLGDKIHVLQEILTHHLDEEEEDVFPVVEKHLSQAGFAALDVDYLAHRETLEAEFSAHPPKSCQAWAERRALKQR